MKRFFCFFASVLLSFKAQAFEPISLKAEGENACSAFYVYGERCSGTNFVKELILQNTGMKHLTWCHKHFPPWYDLGPENWHGNKRYYTHSDCSKLLFVIVVRDVYDWVRSLNTEPHHAARHLWKMPISEFIRSPWILDYEDKTVASEVLKHPYMDVNPVTKQPFENVFKLRAAKTREYMKIFEMLPNVVFVRYEEVRDDPEGFLAMVESVFGIGLNPEFTSIDRYKGCPYWRPFIPKVYAPFLVEDLDYINSQLDQPLETSLGYKIKQP
ncbi:MAG: hypothetical protein KDK62_03505 [Chlamydiia bacterium]|nr:hypothetical protein [Chlamydiia bacterium]